MAGQAYVINLEDYRTPGSKVFTGRPRGQKVREDSEIDVMEGNFDLVQVEIPVDIASINPSFLEEFLKNVVTKYGEAKFKQKFVFINNGKYKIDADLEDAIERLLRYENALSHV